MQHCKKSVSSAAEEARTSCAQDTDAQGARPCISTSNREDENPRGSDGDTVIIHTKLGIVTQIDVAKALHGGTKKTAPLALAGIIVLYNLANILVMKDNPLFLALCCIGPCAVLIIAAFGGYWPIAFARGRIAYKRQEAYPEYFIEMRSDSFTTHSVLSGKRRLHSFSEVTTIAKTEHLIILVCGSKKIALDTDGIIQGDRRQLAAMLAKALPREPLINAS